MRGGSGLVLEPPFSFLLPWAFTHARLARMTMRFGWVAVLVAGCFEKPILPNALPEFGTYRSGDGGTLVLGNSSITSSVGTLLAVDSDFEGQDFVVKRVVRGRKGRDGAWYAGRSCSGRLVIREKEVTAAFAEPPCDTLSGHYVLEPEKPKPVQVVKQSDAGAPARLFDSCGRYGDCVCALAAQVKARDQIGSYALDEQCRAWRTKPWRDDFRCGLELERVNAVARGAGWVLPSACQP